MHAGSPSFHRACDCPNIWQANSFSLGTRAAAVDACGADNLATVEEAEEDQEPNDIKDFVAFTIEILEGFSILDERATKTVSGFTSVQPVPDQKRRGRD